MLTLPPSGVRMPVSIFIVVDFPAPLGPTKAVICPSGISKETLSTAVLKDFFFSL